MKGRIKKGKLKNKHCEQCRKKFKPYDDGRGGDIGHKICRACSCNENLDYDRDGIIKLAAYVRNVCPHYLTLWR
jgi:hypothetical protein